MNEHKFDKVIVFCERIAHKTLKDLFVENPVKKGEKVLVVIGPEGGFSEQEFDFLRRQDYAESVSLGKRILRAETAVAAALSCWQAFCGDWK